MPLTEKIPLHSLNSHIRCHDRTVPVLQRSRDAMRTVAYQADEPHRHDYFEVFLTREGGGVLYSEHGEITVGPATILVIPPSVVHWWTVLADIDGFVARIPVQIGYRYLGRAAANQLISRINSASHVHLLALLAWISDERQVCPPGIDINRWQLFCETLAHEGDDPDGPARPHPQSERSLVAAFLDLLEKKYRLRWNVEDYARALKVSRSTFLRDIRSELNATPAELIRNRTIREAERLLLTTPMKCSEISDAIGFPSQAQFTHAFCAVKGMPPSAYRDQFRPGRH